MATCMFKQHQLQFVSLFWSNLDYYPQVRMNTTNSLTSPGQQFQDQPRFCWNQSKYSRSWWMIQHSINPPCDINEAWRPARTRSRRPLQLAGHLAHFSAPPKPRRWSPHGDPAGFLLIIRSPSCSRARGSCEWANRPGVRARRWRWGDDGRSRRLQPLKHRRLFVPRNPPPLRRPHLGLKLSAPNSHFINQDGLSSCEFISLCAG